MTTAAGDGLVFSRPGLVECAFDDMQVDPGATAAFAASWAVLLNAALNQPAGVVALGQRIDAGRAATLGPTMGVHGTVDPREVRGSGSDGGAPIEGAPWLGALAVLFALAVAALSSRRP